MVISVNGSSSSTTLSSKGSSSLQLAAFAQYVKKGLIAPVFPNNPLLARTICVLVDGEYPATDTELSDAFQSATARVRAAANDLRDTKQSVAFYLTRQKIDEIDERDHTHATGILYQALRKNNLIPEGNSSNVEAQRAAINAVDPAQVIELRLTSKRLKCVPKELARFTALKKLCLDDNQISYLPREIFDHLRILEILNLYSNWIRYLPPRVFDNLKALKSLSLSNNPLSQLPPGIFDYLTALQRLWLNYNQISYLPPRIFDNLRVLEMLHLGCNQITQLPPGIFDHLTALQRFWLTSNQISQLPPGIFDKIEKLKEVCLTNNRFEKVTERIVQREGETRVLVWTVNSGMSLPIFSKLISYGVDLQRVILIVN